MNLQRKAFHLLGLLFLLYLLGEKKTAIIVVCVLLAIQVCIEVLRRTNNKFRERFSKIFAVMLRDHEKDALLGVTWFLAGMLISLFLYEKHVVIISSLFLTIGDSMADIVGSKYGKHKLVGKKSIEGSLGCLVFSLITGIIYGIIFGIPLIPIIAGAVAATLAEAFSFKLGDNMTMPIVSGLVMQLML